MGKKTEAESQSGPVTARGEMTRRKILDAAEEVFGKSGYYETSISEITRRAGVAQGTYYIYFQSKRDIFVELIEDLGKRLRTEMRTAITGATDRLQVEQRGFAAFFKFAAEHRHIYSIVQEAERVAPEAFYAYYQGISQNYIHGLTVAMQERNIRNLNPEAIAYALMGIGHFVALRWLIWPQANAEINGEAGALPEEIYQSVMDFIAHGLSRERQENTRSENNE
jgi:AcrR family transcriptional regulator